MNKVLTKNEIKQEVKKLKSSAKKIASSKKSSLSFLIQAGISTKTGHLKKAYK